MLKKMLNIVKYEWLRRWKFFLAGLVVFAMVNIDMVSRVMDKKIPSGVSVIVLVVLFLMAGGLVLDHLGRIYDPLFKEEEGTFVFSMPLSGYSFLGGKILAVALEYLGVAVFAGGIFLIDYLIMDGNFAGLQQAGGIRLDLLLARGVQISVLILLAYLTFLLTVYLSMSLARSLFSSVKHGGVISAIIFIVIVRIFSWIVGNCDFSSITIEVTDWFMAVVPALAIVAILFAATGYLLDRKVNI